MTADTRSSFNFSPETDTPQSLWLRNALSAVIPLHSLERVFITPCIKPTQTGHA